MNPREAEREALGKASSRKAPPAGRSWAEARAGWAARWLFPRVAELVCHSQRSFRRNPDRASDFSNHWKNITGNVLAISVLKKGPPDEGRGLIIGNAESYTECIGLGKVTMCQALLESQQESRESAEKEEEWRPWDSKGMVVPPCISDTLVYKTLSCIIPI